jgi:hypothetical protein
VLYLAPLLFDVLNCLDKTSGGLLNPRNHLTPFKVCLRIALTDLCAKTDTRTIRFLLETIKTLATQSFVTPRLECSGAPELCGLGYRTLSFERAMRFRQRTQ